MAKDAQPAKPGKSAKGKSAKSTKSAKVEVATGDPVLDGMISGPSRADRQAEGRALGASQPISAQAGWEAAADLGCTPFQTFWRVTFPLSLPGVAAGALLCFIPMVGEFVIPDLLGGSGTLMLGKTIWTEFFANRDWPAASAVAIVLLATLVIPILLFQRQQTKMMEQR